MVPSLSFFFAVTRAAEAGAFVVGGAVDAAGALVVVDDFDDDPQLANRPPTAMATTIARATLARNVLCISTLLDLKRPSGEGAAMRSTVRARRGIARGLVPGQKREHAWSVELGLFEEVADALRGLIPQE